ncbi:hypothetical protein O181_027458 [Austropuccinia psidii MF-1]|uniref:Retrotransposon gag domain-containing protein n=1 Tax=Austropuccinia psidii MF-1 TaxID=1389203 RepID=A0A9Q3CPM1_9BASI|nr:hypothetical protein [Austropuccinia psidii MF-1]
MPIKHLPPARQTRSQARTQAVLTSTPRDPLDGTPAVPQLRAQLDRGPIMEGRGPRRSRSFSGVVGKFPGLSRTSLKVPGEDYGEEEEKSVEEEESDGTEAAPAHQMTQTMANLQADSSSESSRPPACKTPSMKAPKCFDGTQPFKVRSFIQSCQLIFCNDLANFSQDRKKVLYATASLFGRAAKWIEPYLSNLTNQHPSDLLNSWKLFKSQLFTLFGNPNEVRKAEAELDSLRMKEGGHVSLYISDFRSSVSRIRDWGERALIYHFRRGLASRILDQLVSHPSSIDSLQDLMDITWELDTRYHEAKGEE